ncbi:MAG TPA: ATPase [Cyanobacteria bacterium UBA11149]|nr:ATPase [Cyanobacteria bacterium UBA11367]HBE59160.1 ATPase [Cyanobacteria bacterium UBA11366]HBK64991.1 ATPase [Cyanobacteria bacterium UBA11166]HBR76978.1 ATPase [Cyanobacteria bacterium UBA11159]HBS69211.1 ATPase [Cyanobacteria bacterium UBA11153]HBW90264.1 ATPase [Cyanobacteria bacterium UBA11149]HCA94086.1 ATPase [Cyanobacteria bacterium UBA9226]
MKIRKLITKALNLPSNAIPYYVSQKLAALYPDKAVVEGRDCAFDVESYAREKKCSIEQNMSIHNQFSTSWDGMDNTINKTAQNAWLKVSWNGQSIKVILMNWQEGWHNIQYYWIIADTQNIAESFFTSVCEWNGTIRDEVLVFEEGGWQKSPNLFQAIKSATFDNLILHGTLKQDIQNDLENFFASRPTYQNYGVPWKRGILFIGSPGNGKTHTVKALINKMQQPCLYVKSFKSQYETDNDNIRKAFTKARQSAPCILVLEDLDSLVDKENRSFFLNELDGFADNVGIVTLATTNHPERLDPAIIDRPSRFDRKYHFELPAMAERLAYIELWNHYLNEGMGLSEAGIHHIAQITDGFSFAYLKELFLSSMVRWMGAIELGAMEKIMMEEVVVLAKQMISATQDLDKSTSSELH